MRRILPKDNFEVYQSPFELRKIINYEKRKTYVIGKGKFKGAWYHDPTDTTSDDNLGLVLVNAADERLRRIVTDSVNNQWFGGAEVFFSSAAAANAAIPEDFRFQGLSLLADDGSSVTEYWYRDGIEDEDLVVKSSGEGGSSTFEGLTDRPPSEANQYFRRNGTNDGTVFTYLEYGRQVVSTAADTVLAGVEVVICNYNTAPVALTMRPVAEWENRKLTIINIAADESIGLIEADEIFPGHSGTVPPMTAYTFFSDGTYAYLESTSAVGDGEGPAADGSETKIDVVEDSGLLIDGSGTIGDPYILDLDFDPSDVTQTHYAAGVNVNFSDADGTALDPIVVSAVLGGSGNILKGLNIEAYGGVANYSSVGTVMGGTNNSPALTAMIAAAADGQLIVIPHGRWYFASTVIIPASKRVNLLVLGDVFCLNGFLQWAPLSIIGHEVRIKGAGYGKLGLTGFTKADFDNGTGMNATSGTGVKWSSLTSNFIEFNDTHHSLVQMGYVAGFNAAFCHNAGGTANHGGQENTIQFNYLRENTYGILLKSLDGGSYCDKHTFSGIDGGIGRVGGHYAIYIDGYTTETGAFTANTWDNVLIELADYGIKARGRFQYNDFTNFKFEGGPNTGVFSNEFVDFGTGLSTVPGGAPPLGNKFTNVEYFYLKWMTKMGLGTMFTNTPIFHRFGPSSVAYMGCGALQGRTPGRITVISGLDIPSHYYVEWPANVDFINYTKNGILTRWDGVNLLTPWGGTVGSSQWSNVVGGIEYLNKVKVGGNAGVPSAYLHLFHKNTAGTANSGQLKLQEGPILSNPENGLIENDGWEFFATTQNTRKKLVLVPVTGSAGQAIVRNPINNGYEHATIPTLAAKNYTASAQIDPGYNYHVATQTADDQINFSLPTAASVGPRIFFVVSANAFFFRVQGSFVPGTQLVMLVSNGTTWSIKNV